MAICHFRLHRAKRQPQFLRWVRVSISRDRQLYQSPLTDPVEALSAIRRIAQRHASPASNVGAHALAWRILKIVNSNEGEPNDNSNAKR